MLGEVLLLLCLICNSWAQPTMVQSLGIIINYELGARDKLSNYILHFHNPICTSVSQFNIVVSAEATAEVNSFQESLKTLERIIPIHYIFTSQGEHFHYRLKVGEKSKAEFYYMSNMNIAEQGCQNIQKLLLLIQRKQAGGLIGLIGQEDSLSSVTSDLTKIKNQFAYTRQTPQHYAMVQNIRILPRHILELAESNIPEIVKMRKETNPFCEEMFLNFVVAHFYPELRPSFQTFNSSFGVKLTSKDIQLKKSKCLRSYIDVLGYLPLFYNRKDFSKNLWVNPNHSKIVELKKLQLIGQLSKDKEGSRRLLAAASTLKQRQALQTETPFSSQKGLILAVLRVVLGVISAMTLYLIIESVILSKRCKNVTTK